MDDKAEIVIRLSAAITQARKEIKDLENKILSKKSLLARYTRELDAAIGGHQKATTYHDRQPIQPSVPSSPVRTIIGSIRKLFAENPHEVYSVIRIIKLLDLGYMADRDAVRQSLKRLTDEGMLMRMRHGNYQLDPNYVPKKHPESVIEAKPEPPSSNTQSIAPADVEGLNVPKL